MSMIDWSDAKIMKLKLWRYLSVPDYYYICGELFKLTP